MPVIHRLRQQRPAGLAEPVEMFKRAIAGVPLAVAVAHEAAVHFRLHREPRQFVRRYRVDKIRKRLLQHHRFFLPVCF